MGRSQDRTRGVAPERWSRDWIILVVFALVLVAIVANLIYIQVIRGPEYARMAEASHTTEVNVSARRGTVYDRNGEVIASNVDATTIYVNPQEVANAERLARVLYEVLGSDSGKTEEDYLKIVDQPDLSFAYIQRKADVTLADTLKERLADEKLKGVHYLEDTQRVYPNGDVGSQVVGMVDVDGKGISGLELEYDEVLKGKDGSIVFERGMNDIPITNGEMSRVETVDGTDIVTSIDINLQKICEELLLAAIESTEAQGGSATVMDAGNGEIYAACSYTKKSNEEREAELAAAEKAAAAASQAQGEGSEGQTQDLPGALSDYKLEVGKLAPVTDIYEPGSTFKAFTAYSVLANNEGITPETIYTVPYSLEVYDTVISDSHDHPYEDLTVRRILADSSNTGTTLMSREVQTAQLYDTYRAFGFGQKTGCDFPGDTPGQLEESKDWDGVQSATVTFGQGLTVSALQLVRAYGVLEQSGVMVTPHFLVDVPNDAEMAQSLMQDLTRRETVADASVCDEVSEMLTSVVTEGTGQAAAVEGFAVTGKTGTAEIASSYGGYEENAYVMSFGGWLYGSSSDLVCLVTVNRPLTNLGAGGLCGPVFSEIMSYAAKRYQIDAQGK